MSRIPTTLVWDPTGLNYFNLSPLLPFIFKSAQTWAYSGAMTIELWALGDFFALIVQGETGITWTNQTGGVCCNHPVIEGFAVPLPLSWLGSTRESLRQTTDSLENYNGPYDVEEVEKWLHTRGLHDLFEPCPDANMYLMEAWIPVRVKRLSEDDLHRSLLEPLAGKIGVLTYQNSD